MSCGRRSGLAEVTVITARSLPARDVFRPNTILDRIHRCKTQTPIATRLANRNTVAQHSQKTKSRERTSPKALLIWLDSRVTVIVFRKHESLCDRLLQNDPK